MKKSDLVPGTKVLVSVDSEEYGDHEMIKYVYDGGYDDYTIVGTIQDKSAEAGKVFVQWDENDHLDLEEEEVEISLLTLASDRDQIELDFKAIAKLVKANMQDAARLIRESNKLAEKAHARSLADMYDAVRPLINAMDNSGWRSSSWGC